MRVIVVGCGGVGSTLAYHLFHKGHDVTVVDQNEASFDNLPSDFKGRIILGDMLSRNVWQRAEVTNVDALAAVTNIDSINGLVAYLARVEFNVPRVISRSIDPHQVLLLEAFGNPIMGAANWEVQQVEELLGKKVGI